MLALIALVTAALFTGAAAYVWLAEQPARLQLDDRAALTQWKPAYAKGTLMQAPLALVSGAAGIAAWVRYDDIWPWLAGGVLMLAIIAYTFAVIWGTNTKLKAIPLDQAGPESRALMVKWGHLHFGRALMGAVATGLYAWVLLPA